MSLSIYHGNEDWILKGLAVDLHKSISKLYPGYQIERFESFTQSVGKTSHHLFIQQGQLKSFVQANGDSILPETVCLFTHFDVNQFPVKLLNRCKAILFMSTSQFSVALANGIDPSRSIVLPIGVDQELHRILEPQKVVKMQSKIDVLEGLKGRDAVGFCLRYWNKPAYTRRKRYELIMKITKILSEDLHLPVIILGPGWADYERRVENSRVYYLEAKYHDYPNIYNMMRVFCSLSLHEGGPMPLLESMSCGAIPVVTNTGFSFDVLGSSPEFPLLGINDSIDEIIFNILRAYRINKQNSLALREVAGKFTFDNAAMSIMSILSN